MRAVQGERLEPGVVQVWIALPDAVGAASLLDAYQRLLSPDERQRNRSLVFPEHRHLDLVARALQRTVLSRYVGRPPHALRFVEGEHGKPALAPGQCEHPPAFNLSHTAGLAVCAVTYDAPIGVDVERRARSQSSLSLARRYFAPAEHERLVRLPAAQQHEVFLRYWTLKEAYVKARGLGLTLPLDKFAIDLDEPWAPSISFRDEIDDDPAAWQLALLTPTPEHLLAIAVRSGAGVPVTIEVQATLPLVDPPASGEMALGIEAL